MKSQIVGVISDTHGLFRDEIREVFSGCSFIIHAGDVGTPSVLWELERIAGVKAVRGNIDRGDWAADLKESEFLLIGSSRIYVVHDLKSSALSVPAAAVDVVVYGHSHRPGIVYRSETLYLNPGSAGPRRFDLPVSVALMRIGEDGVFREIVELAG